MGPTTTPTPTGRVTRTVAATLAVALVLAVGLLGVLVPAGTAAAATRTAAQAQQGWIRAGHLAPGTEKADVRLTPYAGGDPVTLRGVSYGDVTDYARVDAGLYTVDVVPAGSDMSVTPMISRSVKVDPGTAQTVIATGDGDEVRAEVIDDDLTPPSAGQAKVRLVSAADADEPVRASVVDGPVLARDVRTGGSTGYAEVGAQTWSVRVRAGSGAPTTSRVPVRAGSVYTLLVLDGSRGGVRLEAVQDSAGTTTTMPRGGMDTGYGPADRAGTGPSVVGVLAGGLAALGAAVAMIALVGGARDRGGAAR